MELREATTILLEANRELIKHYPRSTESTCVLFGAFTACARTSFKLFVGGEVARAARLWLRASVQDAWDEVGWVGEQLQCEEFMRGGQAT